MKKLTLAILLLLSLSVNAQWELVNIGWGGSVTTLSVLNENIFAGTWNGGIFLSKDNGETWTQLQVGNQVYCMKILDGIIYVGDYTYGILVSSDAGVNWKEANNDLASKNINDIAFDGDSVYIASQGLFSAHKNNLNWKRLNRKMQYPWVKTVAIKNHSLFIDNTTKVYFSSDYGHNWIERSPSSLEVSHFWKLYFDGNDLYACLYGKPSFFKSSNYGITWQPINYFYSLVKSIIRVDKHLFAGSDQGVNYSKDYGDNWFQFNEGLNIATYKVQNLAYNNKYIFAATNAGIFRRPLTDITTDINDLGIPSAFSLSQNYPNPFNPETTIDYQLPIPGFVTLKVYDVLGREVATLVNEYKQPGTYNSKLNTQNYNLTSGVYFYRLQSGSYSQTKKLILMK